MSSDSAHPQLSLIFGLLLLFQGCCVGQDPVLTFHGFTSSATCPGHGVDYIDATVDLDMTGVDTSQWSDSISIADLTPNDLVRTRFTNCGPRNDTDFYCVSKVGDRYSFIFHQLAEKAYSGTFFSSRIYDTNFIADITSLDLQYPLIKDAPIQKVVVGGESPQEFRSGDVTFKLKDSPDTLDITYDVSGIDWTTSFSVSISDSSGNVLNSSSSTVSVTAKVPGSTEKIHVSYVADNCSIISIVYIEVGCNDCDEDCPWYCIFLIILGVLVVIGIIIAICVYKRRCGTTVKVNCDIDCKVKDLESPLKENPEVKKSIPEGSKVHFYYKCDKVRETEMIKDLIPSRERSALGDHVTVVMVCKLDKKAKTIGATIKSFKKCDPGDVEMHCQTPKNGKDNCAPQTAHSYQ